MSLAAWRTQSLIDEGVVRVLFCGLGGIGQRHLRNLRSLLGDQLEIHAYRTRRQTHKLRDNLTIEPGTHLEADYQIIVHTDLTSALAVQPHAAFICNPSSLHTSTALAAAKAGVHLFLEKPVADSMQGLGQLAALVDEKQLICHIGYQFRFHPALNHLKSLLDSDFFGRILTVHAEIGEYLPNWHKYEDYRQMYAARADLGGGVILSQIHEMDLIYWYFGVPKTITCSGGKLSSLEIDVEDTATSLMTFDGPLGRFGLTLHQDFVQQPATRTFKIVGDRGIAVMDLLANRLAVYGTDGTPCATPDWSGFQRNDMFIEQMRHFLSSINGKTPPTVDLRAGIESLRIALAAKRSLSSGSVVCMSEQEQI